MGETRSGRFFPPEKSEKGYGLGRHGGTRDEFRFGFGGSGRAGCDAKRRLFGRARGCPDAAECGSVQFFADDIQPASRFAVGRRADIDGDFADAPSDPVCAHGKIRVRRHRFAVDFFAAFG